MARIWFSFLFLTLFHQAFSQDPVFMEEVNFARYLEGKKIYKEAILQYRQLLLLYPESGYADSFHFSLGKLYEEDLDVENSLFYYGRVSKSGGLLFDESVFRRLSLLALQKKFSEAETLLSSYLPPENCLKAEYDFWKSSLMLARKDTGVKFQNSSCKQNNFYKNSLDKHEKMVLSGSKKSPLLAGTLSALLPGAGKIYAGKPRQGITSFFPIAFLGVQTWEGYRHKGFDSPRFWVFGSLFSIFYIGNIYGSAITVRAIKKEENEILQTSIQLDLRLSVRDLFRAK